MHSTFPCPAAAATFSVSAANARLYAIGQNTGIGNFLWQIGRRKVENWPKGSGKLAEGKWQINTCSWTGGNKYEIWFGGKSSWKMLKMEVENWPKGEKRLHSRTQLTYARVVTEKVGVHVLTIPIMCTFTHFPWKFFPQSADEEKFCCFWPFVLPTLYTRGAGNLTMYDALIQIIIERGRQICYNKSITFDCHCICIRFIWGKLGPQELLL